MTARPSGPPAGADEARRDDDRPAARPGRVAAILSMLKVGVLGFGGGSALIPLIGQELVDKHRFLTPTVFTQHTVVGSVTPGALPVKLGALAGAAIFGPGLSVALALAVTLPGTLATLALVAGVEAGGADVVRYVEFASVGITMFIIALLVHYISTVIRHAHSRALAGAVIVATAVLTGLGEILAFAATLVGASSFHPDIPKLSTVQVISATLGFIVLAGLLRRRARGKAGSETHAVGTSGRGLELSAAAFGALAIIGVLTAVFVSGPESLGLLGQISISALTSFGGGEAYVAVADGMFVGGGHVSAAQFYGQLVPIANALPGPILVKLAAAIGYSAAPGGAAHAWALGLSAAAVAVAVSTVVALVVMTAFERVPNSPVIRDINRFILPVICGLLITTSFAMLNVAVEVAHSAGVPSAGSALLSLGAVPVVAWLRHKILVHDLVLITGCGVLGLAALVYL